jgi:stage II sporulation protein D
MYLNLKTCWQPAVCALMLSIGAAPLEAGMFDKVKETLGMVHQKKEHTIRVLLEHNIEGAMVEVAGPYNIYDPFEGGRVGMRFMSKRMFLQPVENGIKWGEEFPGIYQIVFVPDHAETTILVNGQQYKGDIYVYQIGRKISIVNEVNIEDYVEAIMSTKVDDNVPSEALAALAITIRTDAIHAAGNGPSPYWDVEARKVNYNGYSVTNSHPDVKDVVDVTKGMTLRGAAGPFAAKWTENSAGQTADYETMYKKDSGGPARGVKSLYAEMDKNEHHWNTSVSKYEMAQALGLQEITGMDLYHDKSTGKVYAVKVRDKTKACEVDFLTLQEKLGEDKIPSSDFKASIGASSVDFDGYGKGAGVGLCMHSAKKMADKGENAGKILNQFFPEAEITLVPVPDQRHRFNR